MSHKVKLDPKKDVAVRIDNGNNPVEATMKLRNSIDTLGGKIDYATKEFKYERTPTKDTPIMFVLIVGLLIGFMLGTII